MLLNLFFIICICIVSYFIFGQSLVEKKFNSISFYDPCTENFKYKCLVLSESQFLQPKCLKIPAVVFATLTINFYAWVTDNVHKGSAILCRTNIKKRCRDKSNFAKINLMLKSQWPVKKALAISWVVLDPKQIHHAS